MKFLLVIQVCSAIQISCIDTMDASQYTNHFNYATTDHINTKSLTREVGEAVVNRDRITIKFECKPINAV